MVWRGVVWCCGGAVVVVSWCGGVADSYECYCFVRACRLFARQRSYKRGVTVAKEGTQPSEFYLLVDGVASVSYNGGRSHGEHRGFFFGCAHDQSMTVTVHTASYAAPHSTACGLLLRDTNPSSSTSTSPSPSPAPSP